MSLPSLSEERRMVSMRTLWLPNLNPGQDYTHLNATHLRELYPNIWTYGPRGDIYTAQLGLMLDMLDRAWDDAGYMPPFILDMHDFMWEFSGENDLTQDGIEATSLAEWRPGMPYESAPFGPGSHYHAIRSHDVLRAINLPEGADLRNRAYLVEDFLEQFTFRSLNRDISLRLGDRLKVERYDAYCKHWELPA